MGRAILKGFKTKPEAEAYLEGLKDGMSENMANVFEDDLHIIYDRDYNGEWTVNLE